MKIAKISYKKGFGWLESLDSLLHFDSSQTLIILFGDSSFYNKTNPIKDVSDKFSLSKIIGCSTAGEFLGQTISDNGLVGAIIKFEKSEIKTAYSAIENSKDSYQAGQQIAQDLSQPDLSSVLVLSDGLNVNGSKLVEGINSILPKSVVVTGGLAGDKGRFKQTWVIKNGVTESNFVSAVGFYGKYLKIGHGSRGGWNIFGPERRVTKSIDNELFELDGKPALQLYKEYLGEKSADLPASALFFPLALRSGEFDKKQIVRTILSVNEETQSMKFAGDLPQDSLVQLMRTNFDRLIDGASEAALMTKIDSDYENEVLSIAVSCIGRRLILGERAEEELEAVMDSLPKNTTQIGFYSYGEISPYVSGHCDLHNQTMTLTTITED